MRAKIMNKNQANGAVYLVSHLSIALQFLSAFKLYLKKSRKYNNNPMII